jgi:DNA modification methylase
VERNRQDATMSMPYYADEFVTLYLGDCLKIREWLAADVLVTDPPYGIAYRGFGGRSGRNDHSPHAPIIGDETTSSRDGALAVWGDRPALVFGTWRADRPAATRVVLTWDKSASPGMGALDLPWGMTTEEVYVLGSGFHGRRGGSVLTCAPVNSQDRERPDHPTPKPIPLMQALIAKCPPGVVADPFAGSGSTLVAAKALGRRAIGVELEERYCEIAARRLAQDVLDFGAAS